tara:strand:+ start:122 stop:295 length:174 start_codon:yes stop_codon:yes gene_type:complete
MGDIDEGIQEVEVVDVVVQILFSSLETIELLDTVVVFGNVGELELLDEDIGGIDFDA